MNNELSRLCRVSYLVMFLLLVFSMVAAGDEVRQNRNTAYFKLRLSTDLPTFSLEYARYLKWNVAVVAELQAHLSIQGETWVTSFGIPTQEEIFLGSGVGLQAGLRLYLYKTKNISGVYLQGNGAISNHNVDVVYGPSCASYMTLYGAELGLVYHAKQGSMSGVGFTLFGRLDRRYNKLCHNSLSVTETIGPHLGLGVGYSF